MTPEEARKLLGGYATGTLSEAEEQALFAAALEDQALFDELAREQSLRDLLRDPAAKGRLLATLDEPRRVWWRSWKPAAVLAMAGVAAIAVAVGTRKAPTPLVAKVEMPVAPRPAAPVPSPTPVLSQVAPAPQRRDAPRPAKRQFTPPATSEPKAEQVELADAPKADALQAEATVPGGVVGGVAAPLPAPPASNLAVMPLLERQSDTRVRAFAAEKAVAAPSARDMFLAGSATTLRVQAVAAQPDGARALGLRYSVERREGEENVAIRFTSNVNAYLSVAGAAPVALTAMRSYTTPPLAGDEVKVVFSRRPETSVAGAVVPVTQVSGGETYVVSPAGAALSFTIPLKPR